MYDTTVRSEALRSLAAVRERMPQSEIPHRVLPMLTRAHAALKAAGMRNDGQNVRTDVYYQVTQAGGG